MTDKFESTQFRHVAFCGGGSGGHLTPAIAVAEKLLVRYPDVRVTFLTSAREIDRVVLQRSSVGTDRRCRVIHLPIAQPPGFSLSGPSHLWALWQSVMHCYRVLKHRPPGVLLGTGAFASVPGLIAAKWLRIPTILFEANTVTGRVNRWWARYAVHRLRAWPAGAADSTIGFRPLGMPVRAEVAAQSTPNPAPGVPCVHRILILGGSQGSYRVNELVRLALPRLTLPDHWTILHQTGSENITATPDESPGQVTTVGFISDVGSELSRASFVISRAGAVTLAEIAATQSPAVLLPLSNAADGHQQRNAEYFLSRGAAVLVDETSPRAVEELVSAVHALVGNDEQRHAMSQAAQSIHQPDAAEDMAKLLIDLADSSQSDD